MGGIRVEAETARGRLPGLFCGGRGRRRVFALRRDRWGGTRLSNLLGLWAASRLPAASHAKEVFGCPTLDEGRLRRFETEGVSRVSAGRARESVCGASRFAKTVRQNLVEFFRCGRI